ncbi:MAG: beta-lactamase family protein [Desulfobacterales bacterium]|nr:beta-lactamase family protein [Desulfobacterales bacterium]
MKTMIWVISLAFMSVVGYGIYFLNGALPIGTGYSAKYICSQVFLAGRDADLVFTEDVKPTHPLFKTVIPSVDYTNQTVTAAAFGFWKPMTAVYREGCGCTLAVDTDRETLRAQAASIPPMDLRRTDDLWPLGRRTEPDALPDIVDVNALNLVLDEAFTEPGPDSQRNTQAIVVVLGDQLIAERYAEGFDWNTPVLGWSMAKSVTAVLAGILVKDGVLDPEQPAPVAAWKGADDPRGAITLDMLLRMSSGLSFEESYAPFADATDMLYASRSMADFAAAKPLAAAPNTLWNYASGTSNILARIITDHSGGDLAGENLAGGDLVSVVAFTRDRLFRKIGAYSALIEPDASGSFVGSSYMFATPRDWARFGLLMKNDGVWKGERILPEGWTGYVTRPTPGAPMGEYGAQFWLNAGAPDHPENRLFPSLPRDLYYCGGFNQQIVAVIPSFDLVVVRIGVTHDDSWDHETFLRKVIQTIRG